MWFKKLTGFEETTPAEVRSNILLKDNMLTSKINGKSYQFGRLDILPLKKIKEQAPPLDSFKSKITVEEIIADVQKLHCNPDHKNALFQAASQFNLLEMIGPDITPEMGVDIYEDDFTQGPACAIACGAGTIYRNYFVPVKNKVGQSANNQIDCLEDIGIALNNKGLGLWNMSNGYALLTKEGLININKQLNKLQPSEYIKLKEKLKVGIQWNTQVTILDKPQMVSQVYCSALPVAYSTISSHYWEKFAKLILEATYEATLYAALVNLEKYNSNKVFLTLIGGGAFGNEMDWIIESLIKVLNKFKHTPLDIKIVSYRSSNVLLRNTIENFKEGI